MVKIGWKIKQLPPPPYISMDGPLIVGDRILVTSYNNITSTTDIISFKIDSWDSDGKVIDYLKYTLLATSSFEEMPSISPDGKFLYILSDKTGKGDVYKYEILNLDSKDGLKLVGKITPLSTDAYLEGPGTFVPDPIDPNEADFYYTSEETGIQDMYKARISKNPPPADKDKDGIPDTEDSCPLDPLNDVDGDGVCGDVDNSTLYNPEQTDTDKDGIPDVEDECLVDPTNQCNQTPLPEKGPDNEAVVEKVTDKVLIEKDAMATSVPVNVESTMAVEPGDIIKTDESGQAYLNFSDGTQCFIDVNTELLVRAALHTVDKTQYDLLVLKGDTTCRDNPEDLDNFDVVVSLNQDDGASAELGITGTVHRAGIDAEGRKFMQCPQGNIDVKVTYLDDQNKVVERIYKIGDQGEDGKGQDGREIIIFRDEEGLIQVLTSPVPTVPASEDLQQNMDTYVAQEQPNTCAGNVFGKKVNKFGFGASIGIPLIFIIGRKKKQGK